MYCRDSSMRGKTFESGEMKSFLQTNQEKGKMLAFKWQSQTAIITLYTLYSIHYLWAIPLSLLYFVFTKEFCHCENTGCAYSLQSSVAQRKKQKLLSFAIYSASGIMRKVQIFNFWIYSSPVFNFINLLLHSFGFYLLTKVRHGRFNANKMIVRCLSAVEILFAITSIGWNICHQTEKLKVIGQFINNAEVFMIGPLKFATILLITGNRFMGCVHSITYRKYASKVVITSVVGITYTGEALVGLALWVVTDHRTSNSKIVPCWYLTCSASVFIPCVYAYARVYTTLAASALRLSIHLPGRAKLKLPSVIWNFIFHQGNTTPLMIVVAFFVFVVVPNTWWSLTEMFIP